MNFTLFHIFCIIEGIRNVCPRRLDTKNSFSGKGKKQFFLTNNNVFKHESGMFEGFVIPSRFHHGSYNGSDMKSMRRFNCESTDEFSNANDRYNCTEATPGYITEEDVWNMRVALSQNSTIGIDWVKVIETLQTSPYCSVGPLAIAYNSALSAAERNGNADLSLSIISDMKKTKEKTIDAVSYKCAILSCVKADRVKDAINLYMEMLESGLTTDHGTIRSLLWLLARHGYGDFSLKLFETLKKMASLCDKQVLIQTDYLYAIESCIKTQMFDTALALYQELRSLESFNMNECLFDSILKLCYHTTNANLVIELYSDIQRERSFDLSITHYQMLMNILLVDQQFEKVECVWKDLLSSKIALDYTTCQIPLQLHSMTGDFVKALEILHLMERKNLLSGKLQPFFLAMKSCEKCGEWKLATKILRMAQRCNGYYTIELYNVALSVCSIAQEWETMVSLCNEIDIYGSEETKTDNNRFSLQPNGDTIAYMMMCYYHTDETEKIKSLLSLPIVETRLLTKIRGAIAI